MESNNESNGWVRKQVTKIHPPQDWHPNTSRAWASLADRRNLAQGHNQRSILIAAAVALASLAVAVMLSTPSATSPRQLRAEFGRELAPDFTLQDSSGHPVRLSDFRGKVVLLNFWATWCVPCQTEIPWFVEFQQANPDLVVLGVSQDDQGWNAVQPFLREKHVNYRVMLGNDEVTAQYSGASSLPTTFLIDKTGQIAVTHVNLCSKRDYESEIKNLLAER